MIAHALSGPSLRLTFEPSFRERHCNRNFFQVGRPSAMLPQWQKQNLVNATVAELQALKELTALQSLHPEVYVDVGLVWAKYNGEGLENDYRQALLEVDIGLPNHAGLTLKYTLYRLSPRLGVVPINSLVPN